MAAEPVGTAYVIIRAITNQLGKDIKDGLDKGSKDADTDEAGRKLGRDMGESAGDEFGDTWNEESSRSIRESADSSETRSAQDDYSRSFFDRFKDHFRRGGDDMNASFRDGLNESMSDDDFDFSSSGEAMSASLRRGFNENIGDGNWFSDDDVDRAAGTFGHDLAVRHAKDYAVTWRRENQKTFTTEDDDLNRGLSRVGMNAGEALASSASQSFARSIFSGLDSAMESANAIQAPGGSFAVLGASLAVPIIAGAMQTIGALAGVTVAAIGFIGTAAAGGALALGGLAAAAGPAFFVLKSAFSAESDELDAFHEQLKGTSELWQEVGLSAQKFLLPALSEAVTQVETLIPLFSSYAETLGDIVGHIAVAAAIELTTPENQKKIQNILGYGRQIIAILGDAGVGFISPILSVLEAAMPIARRLAEAIKGVADRFNEWVNNKGAVGLTTLFDKWYDRFALIMSILGNLGGVFADIFGLGADAADPFFKRFDEITEKWNEWTNSDEGQAKIKDFFGNAFEVASALWGVLSEIGRFFLAPLFSTEGTDGLVKFFDSLKNEWIPIFEEWVGLAKDAVSGPAGEFFKAFGDFLRTLADNPEIVAAAIAVLSANFFVLIVALKGITGVLRNPIGKKLILLILGLAFFLKSLSFFYKILKFVVGPITSLLGGLGKALGFKTFGQFATNPIVLTIIAIIAGLTLLYFHFKPFRDFVDTYIIDPIQRLWKSIEDVGGLGKLFSTLPALFRIFKDDMPDIGAIWKEKGWKGIGDILHGFADDLRNTFEGIPLFGGIANGFAGALDFLGSAFDNMPQWGANIKQWGQNVKDFILNLPTTVPAFFIDLRDKIWDFFTNDPLGKIGEKLHDFADWLHTLFNDVPVVGRVFDILAMIVSGLGDAFEWLSLAIGNTVDWFSKLPTTVPAFFTGLWDSIWGFLSEDPLGKMQTAFDNVGTTLSGLFDNIPVVSTIFDGLGAAFRGLADAAGGVKDFFAGLTPGGFLEKAGNAGDMLAGWLGTGMQFLIDSLPGWGTKIGEALGTAFRVAGPWVLRAIGGFVLLILGELRLLAPVMLEFFKNVPALLWSAIRMWGNVVMGFLRSSGIADAFNKYWPTVVDTVVRFFVALPGIIGGLIGRLGTFIWEHLDDAFGFLVDLGQRIGDIFGKFLDFVIANLPKLGGLLGKGLGLAVKFAAKMFIKAIPWLIKMVPILIKGLLAALAALPALLAGLFVLLAPMIWEHIKRIPALTLAFLKAIWQFIVGFFEGLGIADEIHDIFFAALGAIIGFFKDLPGHILDALEFLWDTVIGFFLDLWDELVGHSIIPDMIMAIVDWFLRLPGMIFDAIMSGLHWLLEAGLALAKWLWDGIVNFLTSTLPTLIGKIPGWLGTAFSKLWEWGKSLAGKIWDGITQYLLPLLGTFLGNIPGWIGTAWDTIWGWGKSLAGKIWDGITQYLLPLLGTFLGNIPGWIGTAFSTIWGWGKSLAGKIWDGITQYIVPLLGTFLSNIPGWIGSAFGTLWSWGKSLAGKIWDGITEYIVPLLGTFLSNIPGWIGRAFSAIWGLGKSIAGKVWDGLSGLFKTYIEGLPGKIVSWIQTGLSVVGSIGGQILNFIWDKISDAGAVGLKVIQFLGRVATSFTNGVSSLVQSAHDLAEGWWNAFVDWVEPKIQTFVDGLDVVLGPFINFPDDIFGDEEKEEAQTQFDEFVTETATRGSVTFASAFAENLGNAFLFTDFMPDTARAQAEQFVAGMGLTGQEGAGALTDAIQAALSDGTMTTSEFNTIVSQFNDQFANADWVPAGTAISDGVTESAVAGFKGAGDTFATGLSPELTTAVDSAWTDTLTAARATMEEQPIFSDQLFLGAGTAGAQTWWGGFTKSSEKTTSKKSLFQKTASNVTSGFAGEVGKKDADMVAPTNRLIDKILLTLARLVKEVKPKVINPFIMQVVDGINTAATQALSATNSLVNRVLLTMARLGNEVSRPMNVFVLNVVVGMNNAATQAVAAANRLVNQVVAAMGSLAGRMTNVLAPAGVAAANGLTNGFRLGLASFINLLQQVDNLAVGAVGNLNGVLVSAGQALINGMIMGMADRMDDLRRQAQEAARLAAAAASAASSPALPWHAANGGIFSRPTYTLIGEAGREAVIPLTRPTRALSLMHTAGLDTLLAANTPVAASANPFGGATDLSILRIDHAEIFDKVDVDIIAASIRRAYMSLPGH